MPSLEIPKEQNCPFAGKKLLFDRQHGESPLNPLSDSIQSLGIIKTAVVILFRSLKIHPWQPR